jgi:hypothetical protein
MQTGATLAVEFDSSTGSVPKGGVTVSLSVAQVCGVPADFVDHIVISPADIVLKKKDTPVQVQINFTDAASYGARFDASVARVIISARYQAGKAAAANRVFSIIGISSGGLVGMSRDGVGSSRNVRRSSTFNRTGSGSSISHPGTPGPPEPAALTSNSLDFSSAVILDRIGTGGSGCSVHRAKVSGFTVAVKSISKSDSAHESRQNFLQEISFLESLTILMSFSTWGTTRRTATFDCSWSSRRTACVR